jgi:hypothetical protein
MQPFGAGWTMKERQFERPIPNMSKLDSKTFVAVAVLLFASCAYAQNSDLPGYLNPSLPSEQRATDLVHRMTVEEKVTQLTNQSRAIERLHKAARAEP